MKEPEYTEGPKALQNFERRITALFKVPKAAIVPLRNRTKSASLRQLKQPTYGAAKAAPLQNKIKT
jgi:hypothetical protein